MRSAPSPQHISPPQLSPLDPSPLELQVDWSLSACRRPDSRRDAQLVAFIVQLVSFLTGVAAGEIAAPTRHCANAAKARQIAMYLTHTACAWPLARVASTFGRDRSTASYACRRVEDLRDDERFDANLLRLEGCIRTMLLDGALA